MAIVPSFVGGMVYSVGTNFMPGRLAANEGDYCNGLLQERGFQPVGYK